MSTGVNEELKDLEKSVAYNVLDELHKDGSITKSEMDLYKSKYAKLHEFVLQTYENERSFLARARQLNHRLTAEKIRLEKMLAESQEDQGCIQQLGDQILEIQNEFEVVQDRDMMLQVQLSELEHEKREKQVQLEEREVERQAEAEPRLQRAREEIETLQKEIAMMRQQKDSYQQKLQEYDAKYAELENDTSTNKTRVKNHEAEFIKIKADPDRIRKQAEKFESAVRALQESHFDKQQKIEAANEKLKQTVQSRKELEEQRSHKNVRLQVLTDTINLADQSLDDIRSALDKEKNVHVDLLAKRVSLDTQVDQCNVEHRIGLGSLSQINKQHDRLMRQYKRSQSNKRAIKDTLGPLEANSKDLEKVRKSQEEDLKRQKKLLSDIQNEVDLFIGAFLKQETLEKDKKEEYDAICQQMEAMQKELSALRVEEQRWANDFKTLASHREKLARDASLAHKLCRETAEEVLKKQLEEEDQKKKHQEISQKQRAFCTMYEVVKTERNKYMTSIQKSSQHLSELKEKLKILQNEVEILKMESASKDKQLLEGRQDIQKLQAVQDQLQNEKMRITSEGATLNEQVEQYMKETDKLSSIVNSIEKEMLVLRRKYEHAVETRNFTGTQLIDRNDELCILWEKSNIQEKLLKKGEETMLAKSEETRSLTIDLAEVQRQLRVIRGRIPEVPRLVEEVVKLREEVSSVRRRTDELSRELENPKSSLRKWRKLKGEDLGRETLRVKIQDLEERLNDKKESLLEKELILEEVTALSEKLRHQAVDGRQGTMELSQKVNVFQSRIKDVTRKMMATVSELSMYQATAHKLEKEKDESHERAMISRECFREGKPPTETADAEFAKLVAVEQQREVDKQAAAQRKQEEEIMNSNFTKTTAEPRVNAYIPEDDHGLPKAYGANTPFKPTLAGATMRHIRKPNPKPVEI